MKAYVLDDIGQLNYKNVDKPVLRTGYALVKVKAVGICGSDIPRIFETGTYSFPLIPGHEFSGTVVEVYDKQAIGWIGKNVGVFPLIPCMECACCKKEEYEMCTHYDYMGSRCHGGFAEYVAVPIWNLIELPNQIGWKEGAMLEPAAVALHSVRKLKLNKDSSVALFGLGTIGTIITQWLSFYGVSKVFATGHEDKFGDIMKETSSNSYQYANAYHTDVTAWLNVQTSGEGVDVMIDCVGSSQSLENCLESVKPGGQILIVGNPKGNIELQKNIYWKILRKQVTVKGTWNSSFLHKEDDDWNSTIKACCNGKLSLSPLITHEFNFENLKYGLEIMRDKVKYRNKVMISFMD